jgi:hypothetical protein
MSQVLAFCVTIPVADAAGKQLRINANAIAKAKGIGQISMKIIESIICFYIFYIIFIRDQTASHNPNPSLPELEPELELGLGLFILMLMTAFVAGYCFLSKIWIYVKAPYAWNTISPQYQLLIAMLPSAALYRGMKLAYKYMYAYAYAAIDPLNPVTESRIEDADNSMEFMYK